MKAIADTDDHGGSGVYSDISTQAVVAPTGFPKLVRGDFSGSIFLALNPSYIVCIHSGEDGCAVAEGTVYYSLEATHPVDDPALLQQAIMKFGLEPVELGK